MRQFGVDEAMLSVVARESPDHVGLLSIAGSLKAAVARKWVQMGA